MRCTSLAVGLCVVFAIGMNGCGKSDLSSPKGSAKTFINACAAGDKAAARKASTGADDKTVDSMVSMLSGMKKLSDAETKKFGDDANAGADSTAAMFKNLDSATETVTGDTATVSIKGNQTGMKLKKVNGDWLVDLSELAGPTGAGASTMYDGMGKAAISTADEIDAGKYKTRAEAEQAMMQKQFSSIIPAAK